MIIDFHTHYFPDFLAEKAISGLKATSGYNNAINGKASDLTDEMRRAGVTYSVNLPVLTNPSQFESALNRLSKSNQLQSKIINFGAIHPLCGDIKGKLKLLKSNGFKGIKVHPFYQNLKINSLEYMRLIGCASELDLVTVIHAGEDASFPNIEMATPVQLLAMFNAVKPKKVVFAHMGGMGYGKEVLQYLCKIDAYFDTSFCVDNYAAEINLKIIKAHGADKILFGTDSPWRAQHSYVKNIKDLGLSEVETDKILYENAKKLLF